MINAQLLSGHSTQTSVHDMLLRMRLQSLSWLQCLLFYSFGLQQNPKFWRNFSLTCPASETGPVSLWYRVPVWTFVSAVHLQTRLVLAETVKSLEQTPSAHYFSIHSDPLSLAFVSDVMRTCKSTQTGILYLDAALGFIISNKCSGQLCVCVLVGEDEA